MTGHGAVCEYCNSPYFTLVWSAPFMCLRCTRTRDFILWNPRYVLGWGQRVVAVIPA